MRLTQGFIFKHDALLLSLPRYFSDKTFDDHRTKFINKRQKLSPEERIKSMLEENKQDNDQKYNFS